MALRVRDGVLSPATQASDRLLKLMHYHPDAYADGLASVRRVGSIAAILVAGGVAYFSYAAGEAGPMVTFGRGDANIAAEDAWLQLPLHVVVALGFAVAGPIGVGSMAWAVSLIATATLGLWAGLLLMLGLGSFGDYADLLDLMVSAILLVLYGGALILSRKPFDSPHPRPAGPS